MDLPWSIKSNVKYDSDEGTVTIDVRSDGATLQFNIEGDQQTVNTATITASPTPAATRMWFYNFSTFIGHSGLYLEDLFVWPEERGKGYGKALLLHLAAKTIQRISQFIA